jgi:lysophospholipase L1-like esterase
MDHRANVTVYAGVGGNTTAQMLARVSADVIAYAPEWCVVFGGCNDLAGAVAGADVYANLVAICQALTAAGIKVLLCTVAPSDSIVGGQIAEYQAANALINAYSAANVWIAQTGEAVEDPADAGHPLDGATHDGVHPTAWGAQLYGGAMAAVLAPLISGAVPFVLSAGDPSLVLANPFLTGTDGTLGTGTREATGTVADDWTLWYGAGSQVDRGDLGAWQQMAIRPGQTATILKTGYLAGVSVGDILYAQCEIETDDDWADASELSLIWVVEPVSVSRGDLMPNPNSGTKIDNPGAMTLKSIPFTVPAGTTGLYPYVRFTASAGTVRVGRFEIRKA